MHDHVRLFLFESEFEMRRRMSCELYIYILPYGDIYIYIYICFYLLSVAWCCSVFRFARALRLDVHGFGFWKNKLHLSVLIELYFSFSQKEAESSF